MAGEGGGEGERTLEETPTWALASVCFILVSFLVNVEFLIHLLAELMLLGFISLLLTVCEQPISNFCLPVSVGLSFLPCEHMILSTDLREEASCQAENSFQLAFFTWTWFKFGLKSCFHPETHDIVIRLSIGVLVHFLCGYVTLPLYSLVTQMGTRMREDVFRENVVEGLQRWRTRTRINLKRSSQLASPISSLEGSQNPSISIISSAPINPDASHSIKPYGPLLLPTKDVVIQVQNGEDQADQEQLKMGSIKSFELSKGK